MLTLSVGKHMMIGQDGVPQKKSRTSIGRTLKEAIMEPKKGRTQHWKQ